MKDDRIVNLVVHQWATDARTEAPSLSLRRFKGDKGGEDFFDLKKNGFQAGEPVVLISKAKYEELLGKVQQLEEEVQAKNAQVDGYAE